MIQLKDFMGYKTLEKYHQLWGGKSREPDGVRELNLHGEFGDFTSTSTNPEEKIRNETSTKTL
jgi:hypothetical protein